MEIYRENEKWGKNSHQLYNECLFHQLHLYFRAKLKKTKWKRKEEAIDIFINKVHAIYK